MSKFVSSIALTALGLFSGAVLAATSTTLTVDILGPGGHSNGDYGNVNAVHAASRAVMNLEKAVPDAAVSHIKGGVSVNAIAADAHFKIVLTGKDQTELKTKVEKAKKAVMDGCNAENEFRGVKSGEKSEDGLAKDIRCTIKQ